MCIKLFVQYACGHVEQEYMNQHCRCVLVVGPAVMSKKKCRRVCGGRGVVGVEMEVAREWALRDIVVERDGSTIHEKARLI